VTANETGWERKQRKHFDDIAATYDRIRPEYPNELFDDIFNYVKPNNGKKALEIGAGTGKATLPLLKEGYDVTAVEIGENMAEILAERFRFDNIKVLVSSFEEADLEENSYDLVYAATAFHWVDAAIGCPKVFRLLKRGGAFALFRYNAIPAAGERIYDEIQEVYEKYYYSHYKTMERPRKKSLEEYCQPSGVYEGFRFNDLKDYGFSDVRMNFYDSARTFSADDYMLMLETFSDHRSLPDENKAALFAGIKDEIIKHGGYLRVDYVFQLYMGRKP